MATKGGKREGAGRKPKVEEERIRGLSIAAMNRIWGSEDKAFDFIAKKAKESFPHLKLLLEYAYGKPKEYQSIEVKDLKEYDLSSLTKDELLVLKKLNAKIS